MKNKKVYVKIGSLPKGINIVGLYLKNGSKIISGWSKGLWTQKDGETRVVPVFFKSLKELKEMQVEKQKITSQKHSKNKDFGEE